MSTSKPTITRALSFLLLALPVLALPACGDDDPAATPAASGGSGGSGGSGAGGSGTGGSGGETCKGVVKSPTGNCTEEMFCKYGLEAFLAVNDAIIARATASGIEADIGDSFVKLVQSPDPKKVPAFKTNLGIFLVNAYGGDPVAYKYEGADMKTAHAGLKITSAQYEAFLAKVVVPALQEKGVAEKDINECFAPPLTNNAFKANIVAE